MWLFFTEMWERFGFYLIIGIMVLYMEAPGAKGGFGFSEEVSSDIYGTYIALVYLTPFIGGILADRIFGYRKTIFAGGLLMASGYYCLAIHSLNMFYLGLTLIILGNGLFKPNISTLLGNLYNKPEYTAQKDRGYNIFYMGINIGAFVCNMVAALLRNSLGWGWAFAAAGTGMLLGLIIFFMGQRHVKEADILKPARPGDMSLSRIILVVFLPAIVAAGVTWTTLTLMDIDKVWVFSKVTMAFFAACLPIMVFYLRTYLKAQPEDKKPVGSLLYIYLVVIVFWGVFHQNGSTLTAWANKQTLRECPTPLQPALSAIYFTDEVGCDTSYTKIEKGDGFYLRKGGVADSVLKADPQVGKPKDDMPSFTGFLTYNAPGHQDTLVSGTVNKYLFNMPHAEWPTKERKISLINTELFQSLNPGFVVMFTPLVLALFGLLRRRGREPSTPAKIAIGLCITALSTVIMVVATVVSDNGAMKVSAMWLLSSYAVITVGELFLSPMGLSLVSKLAPARITAIMMGGWFLSSSIGNKLSGVMGSVAASIPNKSVVFAINGAAALLSALLLLMAVKRIRKVVEEKTGHQ